MARKEISTIYIDPIVKEEAKRYGINISRAATKGIVAEIERAKKLEELELAESQE